MNLQCGGGPEDCEFVLEEECNPPACLVDDVIGKKSKVMPCAGLFLRVCSKAETCFFFLDF